MPCSDTVYSTMILDLSQHDLVLTVPNFMDGRFWVFPVYDFYGNNFAAISNAVNSPPGAYLIRRASDALAQPGIEYTTSSPDCPYPRYQGIVNLPTTYGGIWNRILVRQNDTEDLSNVHGYQAAINLTATPRVVTQPGTLPAPPLTASLFNTNATNQYVKLLELLARFAQFNQPEVLSD